MVLMKNLKFLYRFFEGKFGLEKVFGDVIYNKLAFLHHRTPI